MLQHEYMYTWYWATYPLSLYLLSGVAQYDMCTWPHVNMYWPSDTISLSHYRERASTVCWHDSCKHGYWPPSPTLIVSLKRCGQYGMLTWDNVYMVRGFILPFWVFLLRVAPYLMYTLWLCVNMSGQPYLLVSSFLFLWVGQYTC